MIQYVRTGVAAAARSAAMEAVNHSKNSAMEADTISKHGHRSKSHRSRVNYFSSDKDVGTNNIIKNGLTKYFLLFAIWILLSSCSNHFYQIYKVQPINDFSESNNFLIYEDENCKVMYDFWGEKGRVGFLLFNKSDKNIYINLNESFYICNGIAYDYYLSREFTSLNTVSQSSMYTYSAANTYSAISAIAGSVAVSGYNYQGFRQTNSIAAGVGASRSTTSGFSATSASSKSASSGINIKKRI